MPSYADIGELWQEVADALSGRSTTLQVPAVKTNGWDDTASCTILAGTLTLTLTNALGVVTADCPDPGPAWPDYLAASQLSGWHRAHVLTLDPAYPIPSTVASGVVKNARRAILEATWPSWILGNTYRGDLLDPVGSQPHSGQNIVYLMWWGTLMGDVSLGTITPIDSFFSQYDGIPAVAVDRTPMVVFLQDGLVYVVPVDPDLQDALSTIEQWPSGGIVGLPDLNIKAINLISKAMHDAATKPEEVLRTGQSKPLLRQALVNPEPLPLDTGTPDNACRRLATAVRQYTGGGIALPTRDPDGWAFPQRGWVRRGR